MCGRTVPGYTRRIIHACIIHALAPVAHAWWHLEMYTCSPPLSTPKTRVYICRPPVDAASLHDALVDTQQLPHIADGLARDFGATFSISHHVQSTPPAQDKGCWFTFADRKAHRLAKQMDYAFASSVSPGSVSTRSPLTATPAFTPAFTPANPATGTPKRDTAAAGATSDGSLREPGAMHAAAVSIETGAAAPVPMLGRLVAERASRHAELVAEQAKEDPVSVMERMRRLQATMTQVMRYVPGG